MVDGRFTRGRNWQVSVSRFGRLYVSVVTVRGTGDGISAAAGKFGAFLGALFVPHLLTAVGISGVMGVMAGVSAIGIVLTLVALPEPKGQTLELASGEVEPDMAVTGASAR